MSTSTGRRRRGPVGIAIGDTCVQLAVPAGHAAPAGWSVATAHLAAGGSPGIHLRAALKDQAALRGRAVCALYSPEVEIFPVNVRPAPDTTLAGQVVAQARRQISYPLSEAVLDFAVLPKRHRRLGSEGSAVLVFAAPRELTDRVVELLGAAHLQTERILTPACSLAPLLAQRAHGARQLLIATGEDASSVAVIQGGQVLLERFLSWSLGGLVKRLELQLGLTAEQSRSLLAPGAPASPGQTGASEEILGPALQELAREAAGCVGYCDSFLQHEEIAGAVLAGALGAHRRLRDLLEQDLHIPIQDLGELFDLEAWGSPGEAGTYAVAAGCALWTEAASGTESPPAHREEEQAA